MKTEHDGWDRLFARGAAQLSAGFADRVLRATRGRVESTPLLLRQFALCAATATLCLVAVAIYHTTLVRSDDGASSLAGWQEIASQAADLDQSL